MPKPVPQAPLELERAGQAQAVQATGKGRCPPGGGPFLETPRKRDPVFLKVWAADRGQQNYLGTFVKMQVLGLFPRPMGSESGMGRVAKAEKSAF